MEEPAGTLNGLERLDTLGHWDSGTLISLIALVDEHFGVALSPRQFLNCSTVNDLLTLVPFQ